jgi:hypothetical protein
MTYAPATLLALRSYLAVMADVDIGQFGIVGNAAHVRGYHLGRDRIFSSSGQGTKDYSIQNPRDKAGLTDGAAAIDIKFANDYGLLRSMSSWLHKACLSGVTGTGDIREVIYSPDGQNIIRWDRDGIPGGADSSHLWHTHVSYYRDSESRQKITPYRLYFEGESAVLEIKYPGPFVGQFFIGPGHDLIGIANTSVRDPEPWPGGDHTVPFDIVAAIDLPRDIDGHTPPVGDRGKVWVVQRPEFGVAKYALRGDGHAILSADCGPAIDDAVNALQQEWLAWLANPHPTVP